MISTLHTSSLREAFKLSTSFRFHLSPTGLICSPLPEAFYPFDTLLGQPVSDLLEVLLEANLQSYVTTALSKVGYTSVQDNTASHGAHVIGVSSGDEETTLALHPAADGAVLDVSRQPLATAFSNNQTVLNTLPVGLIYLNTRGSVGCNEVMRAWLGLADEPLEAHSLENTFDEKGVPLEQSTWTELLTRGPSSLVIQLRRAESVWLLMHARKTEASVIATFTNITRQHERTLQRRADLYDPLTQLPREALLTDRLEQTIARAKRASRYFFALLFIDIDNFQAVNDALGHQGGDAVLAETAEQLKHGLRATDTLARLDNDSFVILLDNAVMLADAVEVAERALNLFREGQAGISASIGIAMGDKKISGPYHILNRARAAMREAKDGGKDRYAVYSEK